MGLIASVAILPLLVGAFSCGAGPEDSSGQSEDSGEGSCALALIYRSHTYYAYKTETPVEPSRLLGEVRYPPCDDAGGSGTDDPGFEEDAAGRLRAYAIAGVDPANAFVVPSEFHAYLFSSRPYGSAVPPEVKRLLNQ